MCKRNGQNNSILSSKMRYFLKQYEMVDALYKSKKFFGTSCNTNYFFIGTSSYLL